MAKSTVVAVRWESREPEPVAVTPEAQFRSEMLREYWHEAINAGFQPEEAAQYAMEMVG